ncbi:hypothetical protein BLA60_28885 [Actinophytocola xinjiangensis]|uniref:DUF6542 domain-containing protein n=1 Tax=Actinophytocola xinjiangensis TaxID=485602 RepID=A0A7Z1AW45_9PSEU|nr:hypothetical protein BLA60_28885 [Actinophytocola xinjiangensis]
MTATRDRRSDPAQDAEPAWDDRLILGRSRGLPWWACVALAFGVTGIAAVVEMQLQDKLGLIFQIVYVLACVVAVCLVRRRGLFGPIVQPPLVFALTAVLAVLLLGESAGNGFRQRIISVALSLTSNFPTMAIATAVTVAIGLYRLFKERDPNPPVRAAKRPPRDAEAPRREPRSGERRGRPRPDEGDRERPGRGGRPARDGERREAPPRDRERGRREPGERRGRPREQEPRRREPEDRPRRDDRGRGDRGREDRNREDRGRREPGQRPARRRPPESHR